MEVFVFVVGIDGCYGWIVGLGRLVRLFWGVVVSCFGVFREWVVCSMPPSPPFFIYVLQSINRFSSSLTWQSLAQAVGLAGW